MCCVVRVGLAFRARVPLLACPAVWFTRKSTAYTLVKFNWSRTDGPAPETKEEHCWASQQWHPGGRSRALKIRCLHS